MPLELRNQAPMAAQAAVGVLVCGIIVLVSSFLHQQQVQHREDRSSGVTEEMNPLATALGTYYPRNYVVAVLHDPGAALNAVAALRGAGVADAAAAICPGPDFIRNWTDFVAHRGPLERLADLFPSEEQSAIEEYLAEAVGGASFVTVHATTLDDRNRARDLLKQHGGHAMRYYGDRTITDLD